MRRQNFNNDDEEENENLSEMRRQNVDDDDEENDNEKSNFKEHSTCNTKNLSSVKMKVEKFYPITDYDEPPKKYISSDAYLTRLIPERLNGRTYKTLEKNDALGYVTTDSNGMHVKYRCSVALILNGKTYQCNVVKRSDQLKFIKEHNIHEFSIESSHQTQLSFPKYPTSQIKSVTEQKILNDISYLVACESMPLNRVSGHFIYELILKAIKYGQDNPKTAPNILFPKFSTTTIRTQIINLAKQFKQKIEMQYKSFSHLAMVVDGGTINQLHFLDVCITIPAFYQNFQPKSVTMPYNFHSYLMDDDKIENIQSPIVSAIYELNNFGIKITSITSDNYPNQVLALAPWSKKSLLRSNKYNDTSIKRVIHCACGCHTMNLVAKSIESSAAPEFVKNVYANFLKATEFLDEFNEAGLEKPPRIVKTRWLLILHQLIYIRSHDIFFTGYSNIEYPSCKTNSFLLSDEDLYFDLLGIDFRENQKFSQPHKHFLRICRQKKINIELFSSENFRKYMILGRILWPLFQAILFFEKNESSMSSIYTICMQISQFYDDLKEFISSKIEILGDEDVKGWNDTIHFIETQLEFREFHTFDWPLISLAYVFTPAGRMMYQKILKESEITVLNDELLSQKNPCDFDFILFTEDSFSKNQHNINICEELVNENSNDISLDDNDEAKLYYNKDTFEEIESNQTPLNSKKDNSKIWFLPDRMMNHSGSILYDNEPWKKPNQNRSINGKRLRYHHRPMTDIEFQFEPMQSALIETTLQEALARLQYNETDIINALAAFRHWCTTPIGEDGLNIREYYNKYTMRELWEKIRSIFKHKQKETNKLSQGYIILSDLALTLISCSASETHCERYILKQKLSLCKNTHNINKDLLDAIWLLYSHRKDIENN